MGDAVIVSATRTAIGTARRGSLASFSAFDLGKLVIGEALKRSGIPVDDVDDIVLAEVLQGGGVIARYAALELGMIDVPGSMLLMARNGVRRFVLPSVTRAKLKSGLARA